MTSLAKPGRYLTFILESQTFALPITSVLEINQITDITPVPQTPKHVAGVMNLRGRIIGVVNLRSWFELPSTQATRTTCTIVIDGNRNAFGVVVDAVAGVLQLTKEQIEARPDLGSSRLSESVIGMVRQEAGSIFLCEILELL